MSPIFGALILGKQLSVTGCGAAQVGAFVIALS